MDVYAIVHTYYVNELHADDSWIGLHAAVGSIATVVGYYVWERIIRRRGFHWVMQFNMPFSPCYPFLIALFPDLTMIWLAHIMVGFINAGIDLSHFNVLLKMCPRERCASYLGFYNTVMNAVTSLAPLLSVAIADRVGLRAALFIAASVRLAGGLIFHALKVTSPVPSAATAMSKGSHST